MAKIKQKKKGKQKIQKKTKHKKNCKADEDEETDKNKLYSLVYYVWAKEEKKAESGCFRTTT